MGELDVAAVVGQALAGEEGAWDALVGRFSGLVWAVARGQGLGPADAADVAQTAWLRLSQHISELHSPEHVGAWLATTVRREAYRVLRRHQSHEVAPLPYRSAETLVASADTEALILEAEESAELWEAFEELPPPCRALLRMLIADPAPSYEAISETLGMPIGSIGPKRARCLARLRTRLISAQAESPEPTSGLKESRGGRR